MVIRLKVSYLACKCVFYRKDLMQTGEPMEIHLKGLEMQKRIISTDRIQIVGEKNRVTCLVIMFTPRFKVIVK